MAFPIPLPAPVTMAIRSVSIMRPEDTAVARPAILSDP
jgi:hypothetical protein